MCVSCLCCVSERRERLKDDFFFPPGFVPSSFRCVPLLDDVIEAVDGSVGVETHSGGLLALTNGLLEPTHKHFEFTKLLHEWLVSQEFDVLERQMGVSGAQGRRKAAGLPSHSRMFCTTSCPC